MKKLLGILVLGLILFVVQPANVLKADLASDILKKTQELAEKQKLKGKSLSEFITNNVITVDYEGEERSYKFNTDITYEVYVGGKIAEEGTWAIKGLTKSNIKLTGHQDLYIQIYKDKERISTLTNLKKKNDSQTNRKILKIYSSSDFEKQLAQIELEKQKQNVSDAETEIDKQKKENEELEKKLGDMTICTDITFNHKTAKSSKLFRAPNNNSLVITELKKDEEILFISPSSKDRKWYFVLTRANKICNSGYIEQKFVIKKETDDGDIKIEKPKKVAKSETISIISPEWTEKGKLIEVNASGIQTIRGWVDENKIDEVIVDEKARPIQSNGTFSFNVFIKKDTKEIRITGNKNGKKVQSLIFKIRVGN